MSFKAKLKKLLGKGKEEKVVSALHSVRVLEELYDKQKDEIDLSWPELKERYLRAYKEHSVGPRAYMKNELYRYTGSMLARRVRKIEDNKVKRAEFEKTLDTLQDRTGWDRAKVKAETAAFKEETSLSAKDYLMYQAWNLSHEERMMLPTPALSKALSKKYNTKNRGVTMNKARFDTTFAAYTRRRHWENEESATLESFKEFAEGIKTVFCKPLAAEAGRGTFRMDLGDLETDYKKFMDMEPLIVEELIVQNPKMSELYAGCINTVRTVTIVDDQGEFHIVAASVRVGNGGIVDNFSAKGMAAALNVETGEVITSAINRNGVRFENHPITGVRFEGFQIPCWDQAKELLREAAFVVPGLRYVGWDLAFNDRGEVLLVEGNNTPGVRLLQAPFMEKKETFLGPRMSQYLD